MKMWQFIISTTIGLICAGLAAFGIITGVTNQNLQAQLQQQQLEISRGNFSQQVGTNLVREIANKAGADDNLKGLLTRNGFVLNENAMPPQGQGQAQQPQRPAPSPTPKR
jgi:signal transduction histidine kinase